MKIIVGLLAVGFAVLTRARVLIPLPPFPTSETAVFSSDLSPDHTPCRRWINPRTCGETGGIERCTTQDDYAAFLFTPRPPCPENPTPILQEGTCALVDGECRFTTEAPTCVSWRPACSLGYTCTTEEEYLARSEGTCNDYIFFSLSQPTPDSVCVPVDGGCQWHNPCTTWVDHCRTNYRCGSQADLARFNASPFIPQCAAPNPLKPRPNPVPEGDCLYRDGQCEWSQCRAWLSHCQTSWLCGNEYEYQVYQQPPFPLCAYPGPYFQPPIQPGECEYNVEVGCAFTGEVVCEGGREYQECGSPCPRTCDNIVEFCFSRCSAGCFCPDGTVLHNDVCIPVADCPQANSLIPRQLIPRH